jgi:hypothetical protein
MSGVERMRGYVRFKRLARRILVARAAKRSERSELRRRLGIVPVRRRVELRRRQAA